MTQERTKIISQVLKECKKSQRNILLRVITKIINITGNDTVSVNQDFYNIRGTNIDDGDIRLAHQMLRKIYDEAYKPRDFSLRTFVFREPEIREKWEDDDKYHYYFIAELVCLLDTRRVLLNPNLTRVTEKQKRELGLEQNKKPTIIITKTGLRMSFTGKECPAGRDRHVMIIILFETKSPIQTKTIQTKLGKNYNVSSAIKGIHKGAMKAGFTEKIIDNENGYFLNRKTYNFRIGED